MSSSAFSSCVSSSPFSTSASSSSSSSSSSSIANPSPTSISISTSTPIPTPTIRHTASQSLSPSHIPADTPSTPIIQKATSIPGIPPPSPTSISVFTQLQNLLDITSTLLGLFFVSLLTILFIYWSSIYILHKTLGIKPSHSNQHKKDKDKDFHETETKKKEVSFQNPADSSSPHPESKYDKKAQEIKQRISSVQSSSPSQAQSQLQTSTKNQESTPIAGLGGKLLSEIETIAKIATSTDFEEMGEATGRDPEDIRADVDLEFQRGVADVRGDVDVNTVGKGDGGSVGIL
ncbi:predicted protein [Sclerotinia sclerotiorum 1980 UF-70]|uniref:Uncharacterized protein n=2 Tax=Sclerotinia sclerotiorum (strain ATCC 18683 / 1980 / Ss-1) TaxID=665079 RepID=A0A1D9Q8Q1_SCLS1|nr:predicted protein [Sclerotinia sclerotiorum 1980 UF-70]APA11324.1 hypothetical protein sscle_07g060940 [Sclerotinia sclerotiorum 1980 UF-70]EDN95689.1 predicted protein [Sclerotinia sclerotiorum 1980 UF-70]